MYSAGENLTWTSWFYLSNRKYFRLILKMKLIKKVYNNPLLYTLIKYVGPFCHGHLKNIRAVNKLGFDRSGRPELFRIEAVLKIFGKYPGALLHWSANLFISPRIFYWNFSIILRSTLWIIYRGMLLPWPKQAWE